VHHEKTLTAAIPQTSPAPTSVAEVAFTVAEDYEGRGTGTGTRIGILLLDTIIIADRFWEYTGPPPGCWPRISPIRQCSGDG
jgi:hypothetical protein